MTKIAIVGTGMTRFSKDSAVKLESLLEDASMAALDSVQGLEAKDIDSVMVSTNDHGRYLGPILAESMGVQMRGAQTIESLCSSGANAIVSGYAHIHAGLADVVLVSGADRFDGPGRVFEWDKSRGEDPRPIMWASKFASSYKQKYGIPDEQIATVAARAHTNSQANPNAYAHSPCTPQQVTDSKLVAPSLRLLECSRACTGSAALILASESVARKCSNTPVWISGIGQSTLGASMTSNGSFYKIESAAHASLDALRMAKIKASDIDVAEVHDAFAVCEPMIAEAVGMAPEGSGAKLIEGMFGTSERRINPRGGILGSGHALGATGIAQTVEVARQIAGTAGSTQVDSASNGLIHNMAAAATSSSVMVLGS